MKLRLTILFCTVMIFSSKGQNVVGFETMVNTLLDGAVDTIGSQSLQDLMATQEVVLFDAREAREFAVSHLPNAYQIGYDSFDLNAWSQFDLDQKIVVYCSIGKRSEDIGKQLQNAGYSNVYNLYGGIFDWTNRGLPVVDMKNESVEQVHPYSTMWGFWVNNYSKRYEP